MATRTITYTAWDTGTNVPKTGDVAQHTIYVIADGVSAVADNAPAEVIAGEYSLVLSAAEWAAVSITVCGVSATGNVVIVPVKIIKGTSIDARVEIVAPPAATASMEAKLDWLFMLAKNEQERVANAATVLNDAGDAVIGTAVLGYDGTTFNRGKWG